MKILSQDKPEIWSRVSAAPLPVIMLS